MSQRFNEAALRRQMQVMMEVGYAVLVCQRVEHIIANCWLLNAKLEPDGKGDAEFVIWGVTETTADNRKRTLGNLLRVLSVDMWFKKPLRDRLSRFVKDRNALIHDCFRSISPRRARDLQKVYRLARRLNREGIYFADLFDTFLGMQSELALEFGILRMDDRSKLERIMQRKYQAGAMKEFMRVRKTPRLAKQSTLRGRGVI